MFSKVKIFLNFAKEFPKKMDLISKNPSNVKKNNFGKYDFLVGLKRVRKIIKYENNYIRPKLSKHEVLFLICRLTGCLSPVIIGFHSNFSIVGLYNIQCICILIWNTSHWIGLDCLFNDASHWTIYFTHYPLSIMDEFDNAASS